MIQIWTGHTRRVGDDCRDRPGQGVGHGSLQANYKTKMRSALQWIKTERRPPLGQTGSRTGCREGHREGLREMAC